MLVPPFSHAAACPVSSVPVRWLTQFQLPQLCLGPVSLCGGKEHPQDLALGNPYSHRSPGDACERRSPEMLWLCSPAPWLWDQTQAAPSGPAGRAAALLPGWAPLAGTHPQTLPRLLPPAGLPKQHVHSRLVSRAKPRVRVRLISHADLLCQGWDPVLVRKQTHCDILGSVALSHPLGKPMLWIGRAGLEVLGHAVTIPLAAQSPWLIHQL